MHRREMAPGQLPRIHQKGSLASIFACTTMCDVRGLSQAPPKTQVSHRTQRSVAGDLGDWDSLTQEPTNKAVKSFTLRLKRCAKADG